MLTAAKLFPLSGLTVMVPLKLGSFLLPCYQSTYLLLYFPIGNKLRAHWQIDLLLFLNSAIWLFPCFAVLLSIGL